MEVIKKLNADDEYNGAGISYKEIPLVIFWKDNDAEALYQRIKLLRNEHRYNPSNEVIEDICVNEILGGFKRFKLKSIVAEYPDEFVRKMKMRRSIIYLVIMRIIQSMPLKENTLIIWQQLTMLYLH